MNCKKEDDFENEREVHICDGIDMGNMQYPTKGLVEKDLFRFPKEHQTTDLNRKSSLHIFTDVLKIISWTRAFKIFCLRCA